VTQLASAMRTALRGLRSRRRRALTTGLGVALAAAMLAAAVVISYGLGTGFSRASKAAGLPTILVRFAPTQASLVEKRILDLPDVARYSLRYEVTDARFSFHGHSTDSGVTELLDKPGAHVGYSVVAGENLPARGSDVLVEKGLADSWGIKLGDTLQVAGFGPKKVVGIAEGPDDVGYPLAAPRIYLSRPALDANLAHLILNVPRPGTVPTKGHFFIRGHGSRPGPGVHLSRPGGQLIGPNLQVSSPFGQRNPTVNLADIYLRDPKYVNEVLAQARSTAFGLKNVQFLTSAGIRILLDQAAGIVIDLLIALSIIALITAGVLLAASARAEVQRRLGAIGVRRAVGETRGQVALAQGLEGLLVAVPFGSLGIAIGVLVTAGPDSRLLTLLNESPPGAALILPVALAWLAAVLVPALGAAWPAWRAAGGPVINLLRGGDVSRRARRGTRALRGGLGMLGTRLVAARRVRLVATIVTLGLSAGFVLLMLSLASELSSLETDPGALGKKYALTANLPPAAVPRVRAIPGVSAVAPRFSTVAADSFELGETIDVIAYPGNHVTFEAPPLTSGRRLQGRNQVEVGSGLADALGLNEGSILAIEFGNGVEARFTVSGIVSSLQSDGRVAYVSARGLLRADPNVGEQLAVVLSPNANQDNVENALVGLGATPTAAAGATAKGVPLVNVLRTILRGVAIVDGLVCLYALIQACALTVFERRRTIAVLRACGAGGTAVALVLAGAVAMLVVPAAILGVLLERFVFGPALSSLAENYATLPLDAGTPEILAVVAGLVIASVAAVAYVSSQAARESVVEGLSA
jgi:ABC-type antimicrobial peptide transport system permease subunit